MATYLPSKNTEIIFPPFDVSLMFLTMLSKTGYFSVERILKWEIIAFLNNYKIFFKKFTICKSASSYSFIFWIWWRPRCCWRYVFWSWNNQSIHKYSYIQHFIQNLLTFFNVYSKLPIVIFEGARVDSSHGHSPLHSSLISKPGFLQFSNSISQDSE